MELNIKVPGMWKPCDATLCMEAMALDCGGAGTGFWVPHAQASIVLPAPCDERPAVCRKRPAAHGAVVPCEHLPAGTSTT